MSSTLTINGTAYNQSARRAANYLIDGWGWDLDAGFHCEFHEHTSGPQPVITGPQPVSLAVGGTTVFTGDIVSVAPAMDPAGRRTWGYRALGLEYRANWIPVTATDGSGLIRFNVDPTDQDHYDPTFAGKSLADILTYGFTQHSSALSAAGIASDATTTAELAAIATLTIVPNEEVQLAGERLWSALQGVLRRWARNVRLFVSGAGKIRLVDVTAGANHTLTLGSDPVEPPLFSRNWTSSATRFTVRGQGLIEPAYVSLGKSTLTKAWNGTEESAWTYPDFTNPTGKSTDKGTVTSVTSATTVTIRSSDALRTWATNFWDGIQAWIYLFNSSTGLGITYQEARPITACGSMSAGGTCSVTLAYALTNSGSSAYDSYSIIGTNVPLASGGLYDVWRLFNIVDPGGWIQDHLVPQFPAQVPFVGINGQSAALTNAPMCEVVGSTNSASAPFTVLPATGQVLFTRPVLEVINSTSDLNAGTYATPADIYMLLAYSRGALETTYPPDSGGSPVYSGSAYTAAGLARTGYQDMYGWSYYGNQSIVQGLAQNLQVSLCNTLTEGTVDYKGLYTTTQDPTGGHTLSFAAVDYTTGDEALAIPVRSYSVRYLTEGGGLLYRTSMRCSNRQDPRTGEAFYQHLSVLGQGFQSPGGTVTGGGMNFAGTEGFGFDSGEGEAPGMDPGDDSPRRRKKSTRLKSSGERNAAAFDNDAADRAGREATEDSVADDNYRRSSAGLDLAARGNDLTNPERRAATEDAVGRDNARRSLALRGSDQGIVAAHQSAYGRHDRTQDIVDAHRSAYGTPDGDRLASNGEGG